MQKLIIVFNWNIWNQALKDEIESQIAEEWNYTNYIFLERRNQISLSTCFLATRMWLWKLKNCKKAKILNELKNCSRVSRKSREYALGLILDEYFLATIQISSFWGENRSCLRISHNCNFPSALYTDSEHFFSSFLIFD